MEKHVPPRDENHVQCNFSSSIRKCRKHARTFKEAETQIVASWSLLKGCLLPHPFDDTNPGTHTSSHHTLVPSTQLGIAKQRSEAPRPLVSVFTATGERENRGVRSSPILLWSLLISWPLWWSLLKEFREVQRLAWKVVEFSVAWNGHSEDKRRQWLRRPLQRKTPTKGEILELTYISK